MLKCSTSLWSADLANLANDIKRIEPYTERFHIDVADGHYVPNLLFFPDLVKAIRPYTRLELEVHLMVTEPLRWIEPFIEAGVDRFIICHDSTEHPESVLREIHHTGKGAGMSLLVSEPISLLEQYWENLDSVLVIGTAMGIKGAAMDGSVPDKLRRARSEISIRGLTTEIIADGGIRRETVPLIAAAGADYIVPGSLMFREDPAAMRQWLASL